MADDTEDIYKKNFKLVTSKSYSKKPWEERKLVVIDKILYLVETMKVIGDRDYSTDYDEAFGVSYWKATRTAQYGQLPNLIIGSPIIKVPLLDSCKHANEFIAFDLTASSNRPCMYSPKAETEDRHYQQATIWHFDWQDEQSLTLYLRPLFGELKGYYLDFEEEGETLELAYFRETHESRLQQKPYTRWKAILSPKPGKQSLLRMHMKRSK